ncbi:unnamed protein product [Toxocara canis]|uniref:Gluconokinase n=1 Tax=Toxocara canis TaxID=6265 RepID=A0A183TV80_TOXCA|nr:unnamed protein product [Toxocara canis]
MIRYNYLNEVRQKAADLHTAHKAIDPLKAIVMIQARTRGLFTRKVVKEMRNEELNVLGMSVESLLRSYIERRAARSSNEVGSVIISDQHLMKIRASLNEVLTDVHETFFATAPDFSKAQKIPKRKDEKQESLYHDLLIAGFIKNRPKAEQISLDDLSSYNVNATIGISKILFDVRSLIYCTAVIPHMLLPWKLSCVIRRSLLLIGEEKAGKTAWCCAIAEKCAAAHICISAKNLATKGAKKLNRTIQQFAKRDGYCIIGVDRLEVFSSTKNGKTVRKSIICSLLESLKETDAQVIGMSRSRDIDEHLATFFPNVIQLSNPDWLARFELVCDRLSRRLESDHLPKIPSRLTDLCKVINY